jgi:hypothetical protein
MVKTIQGIVKVSSTKRIPYIGVHDTYSAAINQCGNCVMYAMLGYTDWTIYNVERRDGTIRYYVVRQSQLD